MSVYSHDGYVFATIIHNISNCIPSCYVSKLSDISCMTHYSIRKTSTHHTKVGMMLRKTSGMMHLTVLLKMKWKMKIFGMMLEMVPKMRPVASLIKTNSVPFRNYCIY